MANWINGQGSKTLLLFISFICVGFMGMLASGGFWLEGDCQFEFAGALRKAGDLSDDWIG